MRNTLAIRSALLTVMLVASIASKAQLTRSEVDLAITGNVQRSTSTSGDSFFGPGAGVEVSAVPRGGIGLVAAFSGVRSARAAAPSLLFGGAGLRYEVSKLNGGSAVFVQALGGASNAFDGVFPTATGGVTSSSTKFATQIGGGYDYRFHRYAVRVLQVDWVRTQFPNGFSNNQSSLRLGAGLVIRLHR